MTGGGSGPARSGLRAPMAVLLACLLVGAIMEGFKSETGYAFTFRSDVGNWSSLWLVMPLVMGYQFRRPWAGAVAGLMATMAALVGFYVVNAIIFPEPTGLLETVATFSHIMVRWALFGVVSGPLLGALGTRLRSLTGLAFVSGLVMILEPVVLELWQGRRLPLPAPMSLSWGFDWRLAATLEVTIGALLLLVAAHRRHSTQASRTRARS